MTGLIEHLTCSVRLYIYEIAIQQDHHVDDFTPGPWMTGTSQEPSNLAESVTADHIEALTVCLDSAHGILDAYLAIDIPIARTLPNLYLVWNVYAALTLIKLHRLLHPPNSKLGSVFAPDLKVGYYLDAVSARLADISSEGRSPPAEAFGFVFKKLKMWHAHKTTLNDQDPSCHCSSGTGQEGPQPDKGEGRTPLRPFTPAILPSAGVGLNSFGASSDLNAAYDAATYGNTNWDDINFTADELNAFDTFMNDVGWMGYFL